MDVVKKKVMAVSRVQAAMKLWASSNNNAIALKGLASPKRQAKPTLDDHVSPTEESGYEYAKDLDQVNEIRPDLDEIQRVKDFWRERARTEPPKVRSAKIQSRVPGSKVSAATSATGSTQDRTDSPSRFHSKSAIVPHK